MNPEPAKIQDEQELIESVLQGKAADVRQHVRQFPESADLARDLEEIKNGLLAIDDEEPPFLGDKMVKKQPISFLRDWFSVFPTDWYYNPFILCFALVAFLWFIYIFIVFLLK